MSFVSENNRFQDTKHALRLWNIQCVHGWEKSQMAETLLHIQDSFGHHPPKLKTPSSWDLEQHDFLDQYLVLNVFKVWCWSPMVLPYPKHVVWKGLENLVTVLYFGLVFCLWLFHGLFHLPQEKSCQYQVQLRHGKGCKPIPLGRLNGGCFPLCHCERKSHTVPADFQGLCFSPVP